MIELFYYLLFYKNSYPKTASNAKSIISEKLRSLLPLKCNSNAENMFSRSLPKKQNNNKLNNCFPSLNLKF